MKIPKKPKTLSELIDKDPLHTINLISELKPLFDKYDYDSEYLHWEDLKYRKVPIEHEKLWTILKLTRTIQSKILKMGELEFRYNMTNSILKRIHLIDKKIIGDINKGLDSLSEKESQKYIINALMEEAIASSQLEGAATTRKVAKEMLTQKKKPKDPSEQMILNGYTTMEYIYEIKDKKLTPELLLEIQKRITEGTLQDAKDEGIYRDNNQIVVQDKSNSSIIYHTPPNYEKIPKLMEEFCKFANDESENAFIHPVIKGILLHFLIGYIHPFNDGNGRTARTIFYWYMISKGYWLFKYTAISRILKKAPSKYIKAYLYTETDENDMTYFINHNLDVIEKAIFEMEEYISRKMAEKQKTLENTESLNLTPRQADVLNQFLKDPNKLFTIKEIQTQFGVAYDTSRTDLEKLVEAGKLEKIKSGNRHLFKLKTS